MTTKMLPDHFDARIARQGEDLARLLGVMRMLALPPVRTPDNRERRRVVEIEIAPDTWERVDGMWIESGRIVFFVGTNGHRTDYAFIDGEAVPSWRVDHAPRARHHTAEDR